MDKESIYELQKIDCNCNDCGYFVRDFEKYNQSLKDHERWQFDAFIKVKFKKLALAHHYETRKNDDPAKKVEDFERAKNLRNEAAEINSKTFVFDKSGNTIHYGFCTYAHQFDCTKPIAAISFVPNTLQLDTQHCFKHRKDFKK